jgi:hypothetical protein
MHAPSTRHMPRNKKPRRIGAFEVGRVGIEPTTLGLRVTHLQGICRSYWLLIPVNAGCWR